MASDTLSLGFLASGALVSSLLINAAQRYQLRRSRRQMELIRSSLQLEQQILRRRLRTSLTAAAVAHEINQPLSTLSLISEGLIAQAESSPGLAEAQPLLQGLRTECQRVVELIEKMRMLLRSVETEQRPLALAEPIGAALLYLKGMLIAEQVKLETNGLEHSSLWIHGDPAQIQIAVTNLLRNALTALLSQPQEQRQLLLTLRQRGNWAELIVADSGPGFPSGWQARTLDDHGMLALSSRSTGMGLGLYLVDATVENHAGEMLLSHCNQLGGAAVILRFPLLEASARRGSGRQRGPGEGPA